MAFTQKLIDVQFDLATGVFAGGKSSATVSGLRVSCHIEDTGGPNQSTLAAAIYGLPLSTMNQLSTVGKDFNKQMQNSIRVMAGDTNGKTLVFQGTIISAKVEAQAMPQVCFRVIATMSAYWKTKPATPISRSGKVKCSDLMSGIAQQIGYTFEDAGVTATLMNPYYGGSPWTQAMQIAKHGGFNIFAARGTLAITPPGTPRRGDAVLISPQTGLKGYPQFDQNSVVVDTLFNPALQYGHKMQVQSDLTSACGTWMITKLSHDLESMVPKGKWFSTADGIVVAPTVAGS